MFGRLVHGRFQCIGSTGSISHSRCGRALQVQTTRKHSTIDIEKLINEAPVRDVAHLLPPSDKTPDQTVTSQTLHHLLRLCALPPPRDSAEEARMLDDLSAQLHFVREIQKVDTTGVTPLQSLREETPDGVQDSTIGLEQLRDALADEEIKGSYYKKIRRRRDAQDGTPAEIEWDPLAPARRKVGRYFVVDAAGADITGSGGQQT